MRRYCEKRTDLHKPNEKQVVYIKLHRSWLYSSEYSKSDAFKTPVSVISDTKILGLAPLHQSGKILNTFCQPSHHSVKNNSVKRQNRIPIESSR